MPPLLLGCNDDDCCILLYICCICSHLLYSLLLIVLVLTHYLFPFIHIPSAVVPLSPLAKPVLRMVFELEGLNDLRLWTIACRVARWSCAKNETTKQSLFTSYGFDGHVRTALRRGLGWSAERLAMTGASHALITKDNTEPRPEPHLALLREACLLLAIFLVDDDRRQGVQPSTFGRGRMLGDGKKIATTCIGEVVDALRVASASSEMNEVEVRKFGGDVGVAVR